MQMQASQLPQQRGGIPRGVMVIACTGVIAGLLTWAASSVGGVNDNSGDSMASGRTSAVPVQAAGQKEAFADERGGSSDRPARPTCAEFGPMASAQESERTAEAASTFGCGVPGNMAIGTPARNQSRERVGAATFLVWHEQVRKLIPYAYQTAPLRPSQMKADRS
jgi:hypothetical protein